MIHFHLNEACPVSLRCANSFVRLSHYSLHFSHLNAASPFSILSPFYFLLFFSPIEYSSSILSGIFLGSKLSGCVIDAFLAASFNLRLSFFESSYYSAWSIFDSSTVLISSSFLMTSSLLSSLTSVCSRSGIGVFGCSLLSSVSSFFDSYCFLAIFFYFNFSNSLSSFSFCFSKANFCFSLSSFTFSRTTFSALFFSVFFFLSFFSFFQAQSSKSSSFFSSYGYLTSSTASSED